MENEVLNINTKDKELRITSVEMVELINKFREEESKITDDKFKELAHYDFYKKVDKELKVLKKLNLGGDGNISVANYKDKQGKERPCFSLNRDGMLQMLNSESTYCRAKTIQYIDKLEKENKLLKEQVSQRALLLEQIYYGGQAGIIASKKLTEIEVKEATKPLIEDNKKKDSLLLIAGEKTSIIDEWLSKNNLYSIDNVSKVLSIKGLGRNNFWRYLRENKIIKTDTYINRKGKECASQHHYESYSNYCNEQQYFVHRTRELSVGFNKTVEQNVAYFTCKGIQWIIKRLQKDGYIESKSLEDVIEELESDNKVA